MDYVGSVVYWDTYTIGVESFSTVVEDMVFTKIRTLRCGVVQSITDGVCVVMQSRTLDPACPLHEDGRLLHLRPGRWRMQK